MEPLGPQAFQLMMRRHDAPDPSDWCATDRSLPSAWPGVIAPGEQVSLHGPPLAGVPGSVVACQVAEFSPPYSVLVPVDEAPLLRVGLPVLLSYAVGSRTVDMEAMVWKVWPSGQLSLRLTSVPLRRHRRHAVSLPVQLQWRVNGRPKVVSAATTDVAVGGFRVKLRSAPGRREPLFVALSLPRLAPVFAIAQVARLAATGDEGWLHVGCQFTTIADDHRARLASHLEGMRASDG